jgi:hypothetical protein
MSKLKTIVICAVLAGSGFAGNSQTLNFSQYGNYYQTGFRSCSELEQSMVATALANHVYSSDSCVWMKSRTNAQISTCEVENQTGLIRASADVKIYDGLTSDIFHVDASGLFSGDGRTINAGITGTTYDYTQACNRANITIGVIAVSCAMDANCRNGN